MKWLPCLRIGTIFLFLLSTALASLTIRAMNESRRWMTKSSSAMIGYALAERALQVDLLSLRAGILRNYDPVNRDLVSARKNLVALADGFETGSSRRLVTTLMRIGDRQELLVEEFKSSNALLQNSLTRFAVAGTAAEMAGDPLSARVLKLTLDTSPQTVREAERALRSMRPAQEGTPASQLLSHARLLVSVLPRIDGLLQALRNLRTESRIIALQRAVQTEAEERMARVRTLQLALAILLVMFVVSVSSLLMVQHVTGRDLRAQAANERLSAAIATPLIDTEPANFAARVQDATDRLALHVDARRLQLIIPEAPDSFHFSSPEANHDPDWLLKLVRAADIDSAWFKNHVIASRAESSRHPQLRQAMRAAGVDNLALLRVSEPCEVVIGFEPKSLGFVERRDNLAGITSAIIAIAHGARRELMQLERERLEKSLARVGRMEAIGTMASGVAHNFNNIIGAIRGFAELGQARTRSGSPARACFNEIFAAAGRASDLVDDILNFGKQGRAAKQPMDVLDVLKETVRLLSGATRSEGSFELKQSGPHPYPVLGASSELQQVFLNICNNAREASCGRTVTIAIDVAALGQGSSASIGLAAGRYVVVRVRDTGPGIPDSVRDRLFEPFFTTKAAGTGLGLSTASEIVQDHGGCIEAETLVGGGACFSIWLPEHDTRPEAPLLVEDGESPPSMLDRKRRRGPCWLRSPFKRVEPR
ncbi:DAHL domain-containing protein [Allosphingosinicella deserti]|uniref:histidine kinase n=1 Tax=Allosphingosinicella deserti TaxID=2116704 RepID=A0A2P7QRW2_9SPHN|nr:DAHL domain-containing protein [Sphingomonas deserti]PSJ40706.1 hypothetical protein C7I55_10365 [Sphingomonas deserti]